MFNIGGNGQYLVGLYCANWIGISFVSMARPAHILRTVEIDIPHPRDISARHYLELRDGIFELIGLAHKV